MPYIALDFEATCDEPDNPDPQEIIEFPAVVVGSEGGADPVEFHALVRPVAHPRLTRFCVGLTGIRQEQVDRGDTFPEVLAQFEEWLERQGDFRFVTCGDWDLGSMLPRQCAQYELPVPSWARSWVNLKRIFAQHFPRASRRTGLRAMAAFLGTPLIGRLHSGIDDARNIARVFRCLQTVNLVDGGCPRAHAQAAASRPRAQGAWLCARCDWRNSARRRACSQCGRSRR
jgi:inhibitor of KinA sporulation pathway (predicted exonuclease)